jgi:hypothetical protein
MASEDSDEIVPGFLPIHGLRDLRDLNETLGRQMPADGDQLNAASELLEVLLLWAPQRMPSEERDDRLQQIQAAPDDVTEHVLPVVVVPPVGDDNPNAEELTKALETVNAGGALCHGEFVRDLETGSVASSPRAVWLPHEADRKASFSVYKTVYPATELDQPFLLVFRTRHIVTMVNARSDVTR